VAGILVRGAIGRGVLAASQAWTRSTTIRPGRGSLVSSSPTMQGAAGLLAIYAEAMGDVVVAPLDFTATTEVLDYALAVDSFDLTVIVAPIDNAALVEDHAYTLVAQD
jgi:hypothetical protein